ncbi:Uncharacterised protein [uncultured archaeon]|nr:Uncharacterised protein [uncultured archaeon]
MNNSMWKKGLVFNIVFMFIFVAVNISAATQTKVIKNDVTPKSLFGLQSVIIITWDGNNTQEPLKPGGAPRNITLNIYYVTTTGVFGRYILPYFILTKQYVDVFLELDDVPSYCYATLLDSQLRFPISDTPTTQSTILSVAVDETAPAFELTTFKIHASVDDKRGPFGFLSIIDGYEQEFMLVFVADYLPHIIVSPKDSYLETTPGTAVIAPIAVENHGNGRTTVQVYVVSAPADWIIHLEPFMLVLDVNENKTTNISMTSPINFHGIKTIVLEFTPYKSDDYAKEGNSVNVSILVEVKS